jgi:NAD(P)-dependent dehydrogenase (short-subunit alcohol dehydrogenase family)
MRTIIFGGTSGIGLETAKQLTAQGHHVTVTGRDAERLAGVGAAAAVATKLDGSSGEAVEEFFAAAGEFDHLVLAMSPGAVGLGPIRATAIDDVRAAIDGKLIAYLHAVKHARATNSVTFISASSARAAYPETVALAAVNGAIERAVPPLAAELAPLRVNAVSPGAIDTPWWDFLPEPQREQQLSALAAAVPAKRVGSPADVAAAVAYLTSATYTTGTILAVDGGATVA